MTIEDALPKPVERKQNDLVFRAFIEQNDSVFYERYEMTYCLAERFNDQSYLHEALRNALKKQKIKQF